MKIVLGLGNPGERYRDTRHNVGFEVVELLAVRARTSFRRGALVDEALVAEAELAGRGVLLAKPRTYMNRSGRAGLALTRRCGAGLAELLVVHDDADLELGRIRVRPSGGAGGHNGLRSLIAALGSGEFPRVKLGVRGVARTERDLADYVLEEFGAEERDAVRAMVALAADAVVAVVDEGLEPAMNRFNARPT